MMSNVLYDGEIYNERVKEQYLENYATNTQRTIMRIFRASSLSEEDLGKDLYSFNREEIRRFLFTLRPAKFNASRQNGNQVRKYITWAISEGYRTGLNPLDSVSSDWYEQLVETEDQQYFTEDELDKIIEECSNAQDAVTIELIKNGALGEANEELLSLQTKDIDFEKNEITLVDSIRKTVRTIPASENCIRLCRQALKETEYEKSNGETSPDTKNLATQLVENDYVVRSSLTNTKYIEKADKNIVHRRLDALSRYHNKPNLTPSNIRYSAMLIMARDLYLQSQRLGNRELDIIAKHFNVSKINETEYNLHRLKSEFLNVSKVKELYKL